MFVVIPLLRLTIIVQKFSQQNLALYYNKCQNVSHFLKSALENPQSFPQDLPLKCNVKCFPQLFSSFNTLYNMHLTKTATKRVRISARARCYSHAFLWPLVRYLFQLKIKVSHCALIASFQLERRMSVFLLQSSTRPPFETSKQMSIAKDPGNFFKMFVKETIYTFAAASKSQMAKYPILVYFEKRRQNNNVLCFSAP